MCSGVGGPETERDSTKLSLTEHLMAAVLGEASDVASGQSGVFIGDLNVGPGPIPYVWCHNFVGAWFQVERWETLVAAPCSYLPLCPASSFGSKPLKNLAHLGLPMSGNVHHRVLDSVPVDVVLQVRDCPVSADISVAQVAWSARRVHRLRWCKWSPSAGTHPCFGQFGRLVKTLGLLMGSKAVPSQGAL